jgi:hypothetical protein
MDVTPPFTFFQSASICRLEHFPYAKAKNSLTSRCIRHSGWKSQNPTPTPAANLIHRRKESSDSTIREQSAPRTQHTPCPPRANTFTMTQAS